MKNEPIQFKCILETRHSEKSGKDYKVFVIEITPGYKKVVFPENAELEIIKLIEKNTK